MNGWAVAGINDECTECEVCGKQELRRTVHLIHEDGSELRAGTSCAARKVRVSTGQINGAINSYLKRLEVAKCNFGLYYRSKFGETARQTIEKHGEGARAGINAVYKQYMKKQGFTV